jgi:hypothetical protein
MGTDEPADIPEGDPFAFIPDSFGSFGKAKRIL